MKPANTLQPLLLLVDDDPGVLAALEAELLPKFGGLCRIESFERPQDVVGALDRWAAEGRSVAVAIVDQRMPGLTGIELVRKLRESAASPSDRRFDPAAATRTVLLTGFGGPGVEAAAKIERGVHRYREKPWSHEELDADVRTLLGEFWNAAKRETHATYREFVTTSELAELWNQLELVTPPSPSLPAPSAGPEIEDLTETAWGALRAALREQVGADRPSEEALSAFLLGNPTPDQRAEVRRAAHASTAFRHELIYQMAQLRRLESFEARVLFDQAPVPDWVRDAAKRRGLEPPSR